MYQHSVFGVSLAHPPAGLGVRMHLHAEHLLGIEELDEQRKLLGEVPRAGDRLHMPPDNRPERLTAELTVADSRPALRQIGDLPAFADLLPRRQILAEHLAQPLPAPNPRFEHGDRFQWVRFHTEDSIVRSSPCPLNGSALPLRHESRFLVSYSLLHGVSLCGTFVLPPRTTP